MRRKLRRLLHRLTARWPRLLRWALAVAAPLCAFNLTVAVCGGSIISPLSPFFLRDKAVALALYARHRPGCLGRGHPQVAALVTRAENQRRLPRGLLAAVIQVESEGRAHRISPAGAMGLGQLTPRTARALGVDDPFDPAQNLDGSARYLAAQLSTFRDVRLALAAYNAGPGAIVNRAVPHNGETELYVQKVLRCLTERRRAAAATVASRAN